MTGTDRIVARERLVRDINTVMADTDRLLQSLEQGGEREVAAVWAKMAENLRAARSCVDALEKEMKRSAAAAASGARAYASTHPWQLLGIAAGVGLLAGLSLRRR